MSRGRRLTVGGTAEVREEQLGSFSRRRRGETEESRCSGGCGGRLKIEKADTTSGITKNNTEHIQQRETNALIVLLDSDRALLVDDDQRRDDCDRCAAAGRRRNEEDPTSGGDMMMMMGRLDFRLQPNG